MTSATSNNSRSSEESRRSEQPTGAGSVVVVQSIVPTYRRPFFEQLSRALDSHLTVVAGGEGVESLAALRVGTLRADVGPLLGGRLLLQVGAVVPAVRADVAVLEFNPRILTSWIIAIVRRVAGRRTLMWGHASSRAGRSPITNLLRRVLASPTQGFIAYTHEEADELHAALGIRAVWVAPNAVGSETWALPISGTEQPADFVFSGRLVPEKKPFVALDAFIQAVEDLPSSSRLLFVGEGPLAAPLRTRAESAGVANRVRLLGSQFDEKLLASIYSGALCSLSTGYVGLSMTQSHFYGVPMIYSQDEPHAPEIAAAREGFNAFAFETDNVDALAERMVAIADQSEVSAASRQEIATLNRDEFSFEKMVGGFVDAIAGESPPDRA